MSLTLLKKSFLSTQNSPNIYTNHSYITLICHSREIAIHEGFPSSDISALPTYSAQWTGPGGTPKVHQALKSPVLARLAGTVRG